MHKSVLDKALTHDKHTENSKSLSPKDELKFLKNQERAQRTLMVKWVAPLICTVVVLWLIFMGILLVRDGEGTYDYHPSVLVALISSATVSILALLILTSTVSIFLGDSETLNPLFI